MEATKILLSEEELKLVQDTHFLLTKNRIIEKTKQLFGDLADILRKDVEAAGLRLPEAVHLFSPKVFKGEYYNQLPYVMLDYPRVFAKDDVLAMRTMFWWGNFFSVTLQLKGYYQQLFAPALLANKKMLVMQGFHVSVSGDEWRHDFAPENYVPVQTDGNNLEKAVEGEYLKIAVRVPLADWNNAPELISGHQRSIIRLLAG